MAMKKPVQFSERQAEAMAAFIAGLHKGGVAYEIENIIGGWTVWVFEGSY